MADIVYPGAVAGGPLGAEFMPANFDLTLYRGDKFSFNIILKDKAGVAINLTGYTGKASIKKAYDLPDAFAATVTITDVVNGVIEIKFPTSVTKNITPGDYIWDLQITQPDGENRTYLAGDVTVLGDVTD